MTIGKENKCLQKDYLETAKNTFTLTKTVMSCNHFGLIV